MPNITKVTKDDIINESLKIVKEKGMESLNARTIAKGLSCSIQPVYYHFPNMMILRNMVLEEIRKIYHKYINDSEKSDQPHFKAIGLAYINFAYCEPNYFKLLFMNDSNYQFEMSNLIDDNYEYVLNTIITEYDIKRSEAQKFYENIWVTTHGLASMIATNFIKPDIEKVSNILSNAFFGLLMLVRKNELL